jgi:choline dehydrogenase-like flavoprotein
LLDSSATIAQLAGILWQRVILGRRKPYLFLHSISGEYPLDYHGEAAPRADSRVVLDDRRDATGMRRLKIDLQFTPTDAEAIARSHEVLGSALQRAGLGEILLDISRNAVADAVMCSATDGFHQIGLTRMARHPADGVVDANSKVFGLDNLYIASSSVFRTAGQANPTFSAVALGLRLADHLVSLIALELDRMPKKVTA